ncbi:MAG: hypothetical protein NT002_10040 [candidate division Zixibacteria bacterium]|nr:hypothetical protein [candidate division Zixibacteria bacterium]
MKTRSVSVLTCLTIVILCSPLTALSQGAALYKGNQKVLDLEEVPISSPTSSAKVPVARSTAGLELYKRVMGPEINNQPHEQGDYLQLVIRCRGLVQNVKSIADDGLLDSPNLVELLDLRQELINSNQALKLKFGESESDFRSRGYSQEKLARFAKFVERHNLAADQLLSLMENLETAWTSRNQSVVAQVILDLERYFGENYVSPEPPLLNSQPLPVMMDVRRAPVIQRSEGENAAIKLSPTISRLLKNYGPADLDTTIDVKFTPEITALADSLNHSPLEIYNFVRDKFEFEPYLGSRKGSQKTLDDRRGNDYDQASLLIALLRVSGIPARYVTGQVEMTIEQATNWLGIDDPGNAASILTTCGMEGILVNGPTGPVAIECQRVWVEAWIPFINYRGALNDSTGYMWVPLDPTFKQYNYKPGINFPAEIGFNAEAFVRDYILSGMKPETPGEVFKQMLLDSLAVYHPGATLEDIMTSRTVIKETDGIIPGTLPYDLLSRDGEFSAIPTDKRYYIRFHLYDDYGMMNLDYTTNLPEIVLKQVTISYVGATPADQQIIDDAEGIFNVSTPYLVDLQPVLKIDGCEVARGTGSVVMGTIHYSDMHFMAPLGSSNQMPTVYNNITAGNYQGIGIDTEDASPSLFGEPTTTCEENMLGQEQHQLALTYLSNCDMADDNISELLHIVVMNDVSEAIVENSVTVLYNIWGDPISMEWTGMIVDADRKIVGPFSVDGTGNACDFMRLGGAAGSIEENRLFEVRFEEEAISAVKILELAVDSGIAICEITTSIAADCPGFNHPSSIRNAVNSALAKGHHVIIPQRDFTYYDWSGTGYIDIDPVTCAAGYIISGGHNGGATVWVWVDPWFLWFWRIQCSQAVGTVTVSPSSSNGWYCADSWDFWTFTVPTVNYYGRDRNGTCSIVTTSTNKQYWVPIPISLIATLWGPGEFVFSAGGDGSPCSQCTGVEKRVSIAKVEFPSGQFSLCSGGSKPMKITVKPAGAPVSFETGNAAVATVSGSTPSLSIEAGDVGTTSVIAILAGAECGSKTIGVTAITVDLVGHLPGTIAEPGAQVSESEEEDAHNLILFDNDDDDDGNGIKDKADETIGVRDDDIVKLTIKRPCDGLSSGTLGLSVTPTNVLHVFESSASRLLREYSLDFASPSGDLAGLAAHDVDLYVEGIKPSVDVAIKVTVKDADGAEIASDEVHMFSSIELILRRNVVQASIDQGLSGIKFSWGGKMTNVYPSNSYWIQDGNGITTRVAVNSGDAIDNLFSVQPPGEEFGVECNGAIRMVWFRAILECYEECSSSAGRTEFSTRFPSITFNSNSSTQPPHSSSEQHSRYLFGDWRYVKNPDVDPAEIAWQGENVIQMTNSDADLARFYGHPLGVETLANIKLFLNQHRKPGATQEAFLMDNASRLNAVTLTEWLLE